MGDKFKGSEPESLFSVLWVAAGGAIGALLRFATDTIFLVLFNPSNIFTATFLENILGSFLMGVLYVSLASGRSTIYLRHFFLTGVIGSYTTFSGFGAESFLLLAESPLLFSVNIVSSVVGGVLALVSGIQLANLFYSSDTS